LAAHACNPSYSRKAEIRRIGVWPRKIVCETLSEKKTKNKTHHKKRPVEWLKVKVLVNIQIKVQNYRILLPFRLAQRHFLKCHLPLSIKNRDMLFRPK
jgi:hypothetical protein